MAFAVTIGFAGWAQEDKLDSLTIAGNTFSNVTIISRTKTHLSFKHNGGFASVRLTELPQTEQTKVGYTPPPPPKTMVQRAREHTAEYTGWIEGWLDQPRTKALIADVHAEVDRIINQNDTTIIYPAVAGVVCIYFLFCLAAVKICRKTTVRPGLWAWLPGFQWISLFKAAGMSPWNFLLLFIPPINLIVMSVWCFKICRTRQKSSALGFLLLIPIVNIFIFFYLAFSAQKTAPVTRQQPGRLKLSFQS
jgi:hypothetical protein